MGRLRARLNALQWAAPELTAGAKPLVQRALHELEIIVAMLVRLVQTCER